MSDTTATASVDSEKAAASTAAAARLREAHRDEWIAIMNEEYAKRGLGEYTPRRTAREKAAADLARIQAEFPDLLK